MPYSNKRSAHKAETIKTIDSALRFTTCPSNSFPSSPAEETTEKWKNGQLTVKSGDGINTGAPPCPETTSGAPTTMGLIVAKIASEPAAVAASPRTIASPPSRIKVIPTTVSSNGPQKWRWYLRLFAQASPRPPALSPSAPWTTNSVNAHLNVQVPSAAAWLTERSLLVSLTAPTVPAIGARPVLS